MSEVTGVVEAVSRKFGKFSVLVNGVWYATKEEWAPTPNPEKGQTISFDNGGSKFLKKCRIVGEAAPSSSPSSSGGSAPARSYSKGVFPIPLDDAQRSIIRQNALTNARELVGLTVDGKKFEPGKTVELILEIAKEFESYTSGDIERYAAEKAAQEFDDGFDVA